MSDILRTISEAEKFGKDLEQQRLAESAEVRAALDDEERAVCAAIARLKAQQNDVKSKKRAIERKAKDDAAQTAFERAVELLGAKRFRLNEHATGRTKGIDSRSVRIPVGSIVELAPDSGYLGMITLRLVRKDGTPGETFLSAHYDLSPVADDVTADLGYRFRKPEHYSKYSPSYDVLVGKKLAGQVHRKETRDGKIWSATPVNSAKKLESSWGATRYFETRSLAAEALRKKFLEGQE